MADDEQVHDRPELLPRYTSAVDEDERKRREQLRQEQAREDKRWLKRQLAHPSGRRFLWSILQESGAFEQRYGFGPTGFPNAEASWAFAGQRDLGLRLYHSWSVLDREGVLSLLDEFHPSFPKVK